MVRAYSDKPFQKRQWSRASVFDAEEGPLLRPLLAVPFEIAAGSMGAGWRATGMWSGRRTTTRCLSRISAVAWICR